MKKFIKSIILFIPYTIVIYLLMLIIWGTLLPGKYNFNLNYRIGSYGHMYSRMRDVKKVKNIDILILGSSHAYRGFDPRIFQKYGLSAFNLGSSGQTPIQTKLLLDKYLDKINPKIIIFEVSPLIFSTDGVESALDLIANDIIDSHTIKMSIELNHLKVYNTLLYGLFSQLVNLNAGYREPIARRDDTYIPGTGYVEKKPKYNDEKTADDKRYEINETQLLYFKKVVDMIKSKNISLLLVQAPVTSTLYKSYGINARFDNIMEQNGNYINYNNRIDLDNFLHFYDLHHLNQRGVSLFNEMLIQDIIKNKIVNRKERNCHR